MEGQRVVSDGEIERRLREARKAGDSELVVMLNNWMKARELLLGTKRRPRQEATATEADDGDVARAGTILLHALSNGNSGKMSRKSAYLLLMQEMPATHDEVSRIARMLYERGVVRREGKELMLP